MREIDTIEITNAVKNLFEQANFELPEDVVQAMKEGVLKEKSEVGKVILQHLLDNAEIAREKRMPLCQDCGFSVVFLEVGQEVHFTGGSLREAVNEGVRKAYKDHLLRNSILAHPLKRNSNTGDNTPAVIHTEIVPGEKVKVTALPKGGGSENMSAVAMLTPADGVEGIKKFVINRVFEGGGNPCPPLIVGVGIGGTFDKVAFLAKKAILRRIGEFNPDPEIKKLELELLDLVNKTGVGPQGLGGVVTALAVHIEWFACHIASLPIAVNIQCNSARFKTVEI